MISNSVSHGTMHFGKGVFTSFFVSLFILLFGLTSVLSAQSSPRGASGGAVINAETWEALGAGVTGEVFALAQMGDYLYVGGDITAAGGSLVNNIARYHLTNGNWEALGLGVDGRVNSLVAHNGVLYVGGEFEEVNGVASTYFTTFDGTNWSSPTAQPVLTGLPGKVSAMLVLDGYVYVGGDFDAIGDLSTKTIARYSINGGTWEALTPSANFFTGSGCSVISMATDGTSIYVSVPCAAEIGGQTYSGLFSYTPGTTTWAPVGDGLDEFSAPLGLAVHDGFLYAAGYGMYVGDFILGTSGDPDVEFFGRYDLSTPSSGWASLGNPLDDAATDVVIADGSAYVIGQFTSIDALSSQGMAVLDLETLNWSSIGALNYTSNGGGAGNNVIELIGNKLVVGGVIENAGGVEVSNVARYSKTFTGGGSGGDGGGGDGGGGPVTFALTAPSNGATGVSVQPLLTWNAPVGVTVDYYMIEIHTTSDLSDFAEFPFGSITSNSYQWGSDIADPILFGNTTYYWIVKGYDNSDALVAQSAETFSFTTASLVLSTPTLVAPVDNASDVSLTPTFTWSKDALAESYVLEYSTGATLSGTPTQVPLALGDLNDADPNYSYTLPGGSELETNTQYSWRVIAQKAGEDDMPSAEASFTTVDLSPGAFNWGYEQLEFIVSENDNVFVITWNGSDRATSYELNFKIGDQPFNVFGDAVTVNAPATSYVVDNTKLVDGFTYTVELTAVNEYGRTSTDPLTIVYTPTKPVAVSPKDGAAVDATTSFTWESTENFSIIPGNILVQILYSNDENADPVANSSDGIQFEFTGSTEVTESKTLTELFATQNSVELSNFLSDNMGRTLYWRVSNKSIRLADDDPASQREVVWSDLASFYVLYPETISLGVPSTNVLNIAEGTEFSWVPFEVAQDAVQPQYVIEFSETGEFASSPVKTDYQTFHESPYVPTGSLLSGELRHGTTYSWRVLGFAGDQVMKSEIRTFKTELETPLILLSRVNNLVGVKEEITIFKIKNATSYILEYTSDSFDNEESIKSFTLLESDFRADPITSGSASDNENVIIEWITLNYERNKEGDVWEPSTTYQLRVTVVDGESTPKTSEIETFTTQPLPGLFSLNTPESSSVGVSVSPTFTWEHSSNATEYEFQLSGTSGFEDELLIASESIGPGNINEPISYSYDGDPLFYISTYYWRVIAKGPGGERISDVYSFTTIPSPATKLSFTTNSQTIRFGETSGQFTVELRDADGNATTRLEATEVSLEANPSSGITFRNVANDADITSVTIPIGQSSGSFKVISATAGAKTITASFTGLTSAEQNLIVHPFASGSGTEEDPYVITNVTQLQAMKDYLSLYFILGNDIDASSTGQTDGLDFEPIGTSGNPFEGSLNGDGKKITGLTIKQDITFVGMFGVAGSRSNIRNVLLEDVEISGSNVVGGLAGRSNGNISKSYSTGSVTGTGGIVGGLVGQNGGLITHSYSTASVSGTNSVGGLVGTGNGNITNSYSSGSVTGFGMHAGGLIGYNEGNVTESYSSGSIDGKTNTGGLVGQNKGSITISYSSASVKGTDSVGGLSGYNDNSITDSYSIGSVSGVSNVGGLVGINVGPIKNSYSSGSVSELGTESRNLGGLVGFNNSGTISSSYWDTQTSGQATSAGGTGKTTAEMKTQATFLDWDFEEIWTIDPAKNKGYPYLKDVYVEDSPQVLPITLLGPGSSDNDVPENITLRPSFNWEALTDLENVYYILEVSKNEDFSTLFGSATTQELTSNIDSDLDGPATYYWQVKAKVGAQGNEIVGQSAVRSFKTNTGIELVSLDNEATIVDLNSVFEWYSNDSNFFLSIQEPGTNKILAVNPSPTKRYTLQEVIDNRLQNLSPENTLKNLEPEKTYQWSVSRFDAKFNFLGSSETRTFTTSAAFGIDSPVLNTPVETDVFSFSWSGDETARYIFEIDDNKTNLESAGPSATRDDITFAGTASGNSLELASGRLTSGTTYYWRVSLVVKSGDNTAYVTSEVGEFTPKAAPGVITVTSPANNATNVAVTGINFSWEPDASATKYQVLVYESTNLETPVIDKTVDADGDGIQSAQFGDVPSLKYSTNYRWRVIGYNDTKRGELNDLSSFKTRNIIEGGGTVATKLMIVSELPTSLKSGQRLPQIVVAAVDATGKLVESVNSLVTMSSTGFDAPRVLPFVGGLVTFNNVFFNSVSSGFTITFTSGTLTVNSTPIRVSAVGPDELVVTKAPPKYVVKNSTFTAEVRAVDASGFLLDDDSETIITATLSGSTSATLSGTLTKKVANGIATFDELKISNAGTYTLTFSAYGFSSISGTIRVFNDAAAATSFLASEQVGSSSMSFPIKKALALGICKQLNLSSASCARVTVSNSSSTNKTLSGAAGSEISNDNDGLLPLLWSAPQDSLFLEYPVTHYAIEFRETGTENWTVFSRPQSPDTVAVITGLKLDTSYEARVAYVTELGASEFSEPVTFETLDLQTILDFIDEVADEIIATSIEVEEMPTEFALFQNYPNPFNPTTTIRFALPEPSEVQLEVYSILGQRIAVLSTGLKPAGYHSLQLDASRWASGTYIYRLRAGDRVFTKKLLLLK